VFTDSDSYNAFVPELLTGRFRARKLASQYNAPIPDETTEEELMSRRGEILKQFFGSLGKNSFIEPPLNVDYGCNILIGDDFYSNFGLDHCFPS
jgi:acetyltransferase-like isoleucine patch superfamily enzyme